LFRRSAGKIRASNRSRKQHIADKHHSFISLVKHNVTGRVSRTVKHFEFKLTNGVFITVSPMMIDWRRLLESKPERRPLRSWNTNPRRLLRQRLVHELVAFVQVDFRVRLQLFQRRNATDVIEVRVSQRDRVELKTAALECLDDPFRFIARIDADRLFCFFTTDDACVLLKCSDGDFFDDHWLCIILHRMPVSTKSAPLAAVLDSMTTEGAPELTEHLEAGADHVPVQVLTSPDKLVPALAELAGPLGLQ